MFHDLKKTVTAHTDNLFLDLIIQNPNWIAIPLFWLIWHETELLLVPIQLKNCDYNPKFGLKLKRFRKNFAVYSNATCSIIFTTLHWRDFIGPILYMWDNQLSTLRWFYWAHIVHAKACRHWATYDPGTTYRYKCDLLVSFMSAGRKSTYMYHICIHMHTKLHTETYINIRDITLIVLLQ